MQSSVRKVLCTEMYCGGSSKGLHGELNPLPSGFRCLFRVLFSFGVPKFTYEAKTEENMQNVPNSLLDF